MNRDNAKDYLPLVQALADGKDVQYKGESLKQWITLTGCDFNQPAEDFRIKPEPREFWINNHELPSHHYWITDEQHQSGNWDKNLKNFIKVREVIE